MFYSMLFSSFIYYQILFNQCIDFLFNTFNDFRFNTFNDFFNFFNYREN